MARAKHNDVLERMAFVSAQVDRLPKSLVSRLSGYVSHEIGNSQLIASNFAGPPVPISIFGCEATDVFASPQVETGDGIKITSCSYADDLYFTICIDDMATHDSSQLAAAIEHGIREVVAVGEVVRRIERTPFLAALRLDSLDAILAACEVRSFASDTTLFESGDDPREMFVIEEGEVQVSDAFGAVANRIEPDAVGAAAVLAGKPYRRTAIAQAGARVIAIPGNTLRRVLDDDLNAQRVAEAEIIADRMSLGG